MIAAAGVCDRGLNALLLTGRDGVGGGGLAARVVVAADVDQLESEAGEAGGSDVNPVLINQRRGLPVLDGDPGPGRQGLAAPEIVRLLHLHHEGEAVRGARQGGPAKRPADRVEAEAVAVCGRHHQLVVEELDPALVCSQHGQTVHPPEGAGLDHVRELVANHELLLPSQQEKGEQELLVRPKLLGLVDILKAVKNVRDNLRLGDFRPTLSDWLDLQDRVRAVVLMDVWLQLCGDIASAQLVESLELCRMFTLSRNFSNTAK